MIEQTVHAMPVEIVKAIITIMGKVKKLAKEGNNVFARYRFTSVDQFYEAVGQLISEHGLCNITFERSLSVEVRETTNDKGETKKGIWMTGEYDIVLYHESGAMSEPIARTITVQATGPQSYASAQSYVEKYFWRNLLKIPTGDKDEVDEAAQNGLPEGSVVNLRHDKKISATQVQMIQTALDTLTDKTIEAAMLAEVGVDKIADIPLSKAGRVMAGLAHEFHEQQSKAAPRSAEGWDGDQLEAAEAAAVKAKQQELAK
jgi:hypothetical protein